MITVLNRDIILHMMKLIYVSGTKTRIVRKKRERRLPIRETIRKDACNNVR